VVSKTVLGSCNAVAFSGYLFRLLFNPEEDSTMILGNASEVILG
jgi:hypothetical protein